MKRRLEKERGATAATALRSRAIAHPSAAPRHHGLVHGIMSHSTVMDTGVNHDECGVRRCATIAGSRGPSAP